MRVVVRTFGDLIPLVGRKQMIETQEGTSVKAVVRQVSSQAGSTRPGYIGNYRIGGNELVVLVNGRNIATLDGVETVLKDGDVVTLLPPFAGG